MRPVCRTIDSVAVGPTLSHRGGLPTYALRGVRMSPRSPTMIEPASGRVAIVYPWRWPLPALASVCENLAQAGFVIEVYCAEGCGFAITSRWERMISVSTGEPALLRGALSSAPGWLRGRAERPRRRIVSAMSRSGFLRRLHQRHRRLPYACMLGVDTDGLEAARWMAEELGVAHALWSLEIWALPEECPPEQLRRKVREESDCRSAAFVIVQDPWRGDLLSRANHLSDARFIYLPNSRGGSSRSRVSDLLRTRLSLPAQCMVVLYSRFLSHWSLADEIAANTVDWPARAVLVLNSRVELPEKRARELESLAPAGRVWVARHPVPDAEYFELVDSADVGIALYGAERVAPAFRDNLEVMGYSSGKVADYFQAGLPIVVNDICGPRDLVHEFKCGAVVPDVAAISEALTEIEAHREEYSQNARVCFDARLRLENHAPALVDILRSLAQRYG